MQAESQSSGFIGSISAEYRVTPDIVVDDETVPAATAEGGPVPGERTNPSCMPLEGADLLHSVGVPQLHVCI